MHNLVGGAKEARANSNCLQLSQRCLVAMSTLEDFEDLVREKIVKERWTHKQISGFLMESCPGQRGFSVRSIERFCSNKGIHKTSRINDLSLDVAVSKATAMVRSILIIGLKLSIAW